jgi:hypothetical protein
MVDNNSIKYASTVNTPDNNKKEFNYVNKTNKILFYTSLVVLIILLIIIININTIAQYINVKIILICCIISLIISLASTVLLIIEYTKIDKETKELKEGTYEENSSTSKFMIFINALFILFNIGAIVISFTKL